MEGISRGVVGSHRLAQVAGIKVALASFYRMWMEHDWAMRAGVGHAVLPWANICSRHRGRAVVQVRDGQKRTSRAYRCPVWARPSGQSRGNARVPTRQKTPMFHGSRRRLN